MRKFNAEKLPIPKCEEKFPQGLSMPIDLEIGAGAGLNAIQYSKANPERFLISIERTQEKFEKMKRRAENHQHENLMVVHADAINFTAHRIPDNSLSRVLILYPNPYPKNKAARFPFMPFMGCLLSKMKNGAELVLATNDQSYYEEAKLEYQETWNLELIEDGTWSDEKGPRTHFEKKYLQRGETCYNLIFKK